MAKTMVSPSPATPKLQTASNQPTQEEIALRAYHIYLQRGGAPGNEVEDWMRAERQLLEESDKPRRKAAVKSIAA
jgi:Protein of unknown function (DUF2934)